MLQSRDKSRPQDWKIPVICVFAAYVGCSILYFSALSKHFAVLDDYRMVLAVEGMRPFRIEGHAAVELATGRIIPAYLFDLFWFRVDSLENLTYVRWIGFSIVVLTILAICIWFVRMSQTDKASPFVLVIPVSLLTMSLPSVAATVTWAQKATQLLAFPLSATAGIIFARANLSSRLRVVAVMLTVVAAFTYQQFGLFTIFPVAMWAAVHYSTGTKWVYRRRLLEVLMTCFIALLLNMTFVRVRSPDVLSGIQGRVFPDRIEAVLSSYIPKSSHLMLDKSLPSVMISGVVLGVLVLLVGLVNHKSLVVVLASLLTMATTALIVLGGSVDVSYRLIFPGQIAIWLGLSLALIHALTSPDKNRAWTRPASAFGYCCIAILFALYARDVPTTHIAERNAEQWEEAKCHLKHASQNIDLSRMVFRLDHVEFSGNAAVYSEIGLTARHVDWILADQILMLVTTQADLSVLQGVPLEVLDPTDALPSQSLTVFVADLQVPCPRLN